MTDSASGVLADRGRKVIASGLWQGPWRQTAGASFQHQMHRSAAQRQKARNPGPARASPAPVVSAVTVKGAGRKVDPWFRLVEMQKRGRRTPLLQPISRPCYSPVMPAAKMSRWPNISSWPSQKRVARDPNASVRAAPRSVAREVPGAHALRQADGLGRDARCGGVRADYRRLWLATGKVLPKSTPCRPPSCFTAQPRIMAITRSPSASACVKNVAATTALRHRQRPCPSIRIERPAMPVGGFNAAGRKMGINAAPGM